ncbi:hypothetical protein CSIRO_0009 [Bradyrhizobiaceae bacterium SG-6C]|nr:hypothetical protein CSIRO_0009 [Bradyrhizobiaceae bacterium SG-6C]
MLPAAARPDSLTLFTFDELYGELLNNFQVRNKLRIRIVHAACDDQVNYPTVLLDSSAHTREVRRETMANCIKFVRDGLVGLGQQRVFRGIHQRLMEFRIHSLGFINILSFDRERSGRDSFGHGDREPFGVICQETKSP